MRASLHREVEGAHPHNYRRKLYPARKGVQPDFQFHQKESHQEDQQMGAAQVQVMFRLAKKRCSSQNFHLQA